MRHPRIGSKLAAGLVLLVAGAAQAAPETETTKFAVLRNDTPIGTNTVSVGREGAETNVRIVTHISVSVAFVTLYKYDQTESEQWTDGHLVALNSETDDNGKLHRVSASARGRKLLVEGDGQWRSADESVFPISLWSPPVPEAGVGLDPEDGSITPVSVVDRGAEDVIVAGRPEHAHHYLIKTSSPQDVWYDAHNRLIKMEMRGSDGSTICYQLI